MLCFRISGCCWHSLMCSWGQGYAVRAHWYWGMVFSALNNGLPCCSAHCNQLGRCSEMLIALTRFIRVVFALNRVDYPIADVLTMMSIPSAHVLCTPYMQLHTCVVAPSPLLSPLCTACSGPSCVYRRCMCISRCHLIACNTSCVLFALVTSGASASGQSNSIRLFYAAL